VLEASIERDFHTRTKGYQIYERPGAVVKEGALLAGGERIYLGPGACIQPGAVLNAEDGPIYIDDNATVFENAIVRGPAFIGACSQVKPGADIEACAIGPHAKVGGEVLHTVFHSYANKAHDGHLGHAYIGRWCNLGADTNNSNLKNDYSVVTLFDAVAGAFEPTGRQFMGLVMADHAKCGIDTMFNTGTVVGVFCNIYGSGFQPRHLPSFSWGGADTGFTEYRLDKALRVAEAVMARRQIAFTDADRELLTHVFTMTRPGRRNGYI
jgi:UDP-N-acetylglucosamine diphosphorylase/glucosamine-1-phosphate N-acetyltransferase